MLRMCGILPVWEQVVNFVSDYANHYTTDAVSCKLKKDRSLFSLYGNASSANF
jgi:hypothetical protein